MLKTATPEKKLISGFLGVAVVGSVVGIAGSRGRRRSEISFCRT